MAGRGQAVRFHGAFSTKPKAQRKEAATPHAYIRRVKMRGGIRYLVLTRI